MRVNGPVLPENVILNRAISRSSVEVLLSKAGWRTRLGRTSQRPRRDSAARSVTSTAVNPRVAPARADFMGVRSCPRFLHPRVRGPGTPCGDGDGPNAGCLGQAFARRPAAIDSADEHMPMWRKGTRKIVLERRFPQGTDRPEVQLWAAE